MNISDSSRHLLPGEAVVIENIDLDTQKKALVGRYGTFSINTTGGFQYEPHELYRAIAGTTLLKYLLVAADADATPTAKKLYYLDTSATPPVPVEIKSAGYTDPGGMVHAAGDPFTLNATAHLSFATVYDPTMLKNLVFGTNGHDYPFYIDFATGYARFFKMGATSNIKPTVFLPYEWNGHMWAINGQEIHYSDPDNFLLWNEDSADAGYDLADGYNYQNPPRALIVLRDRLLTFNLDCIGYLDPTNDADNPYTWKKLTENAGTLSSRTVVGYQGNVVFIDKRPPFVFMFTGQQVVPLDPEGKMSKGFEQYVDFSKLDTIKACVWGNNLKISIPLQSGNPASSGDARWLATCNLARKGQIGYNNFPWTMDTIHANDLAQGQESTDYGQCWFTDAVKQTNGYYFVNRLGDEMTPETWTDTSVTPSVKLPLKYGDFNGIAGNVNSQNITYLLQTGWMDSDYLQKMVTYPLVATRLVSYPFHLIRFYLDGDWEGTPAITDVLRIQYRFNGWTDWKNINVLGVKYQQWAPVSGQAYGRMIQFRVYFTSKTARPVLYKLGVEIRMMAGFMR